MKRLVLFFGLFIWGLGALWAQDTLLVSRNSLQQQVQVKNYQLAVSQAEINTASAEYQQSQWYKLPQISASYTPTVTNSPLMAFGSKLNQSRVKMQDFDPATLNHADGIFNFGTKLEVKQPIFNKDAVYMQKAAGQKIDALKLKMERTKEYLSYEVARAYMQLQLAYKVEKVLNLALNTAKANKNTIDNFYKNGMIQKPDVLYMDIRVGEIENAIQQSQSNIRNASDYIRFLTGKSDSAAVLKPLDTLAYLPFAADAEPGQLNVQRKDILAYKKSVDAYSLMGKAAKAKLLPRLNAFGTFELNDNTPVEFNGYGYMVGVQLSWNIFDGFMAKREQNKYNMEVQKANAEIAQYIAQNELELIKSYRQVLDARKKVDLSKLVWGQAKEAYRIKQNRFKEGLEKPSDLLNAETQVSQKELDYYQAVYEHNAALEYYKLLK